MEKIFIVDSTLFIPIYIIYEFFASLAAICFVCVLQKKSSTTAQTITKKKF